MFRLSAFFLSGIVFAVWGQDTVAQETWTVDPTPQVSIGTADGDAAEVLTNPLRATVLSDGTIVIQESVLGFFEIRYFDSEGRHLLTASRHGQGPFEFTAGAILHPWSGDSVAVFGRDQRFAIFGPRGERVREGRLEFPDASRVGVGTFLDEERVAVLKSLDTGELLPGVQQTPQLMMILRLDGQRADTLGRVGSQPSVFETTPDGGVFIYPYPFPSSSYIGANSGRLWVGQSNQGEIRSYNRDGSPGPTFTVPWNPEPVRRADRERMRGLVANSVGSDRAERYARYARSMEFPEHFPLYETLKVSVDGHLWIQHYEPPWATGPQVWSVFDQTGALKARVEVPASALHSCSRRLRPCGSSYGVLEVGEDYLLMVQRDELGVLRVVKYEVKK